MGRRHSVFVCGLMLGAALVLWGSWVALAQLAKDEVFENLKQADAAFMRGFTVTATRVLPPWDSGAPEVTMKWQMTLEGPRCAVIEKAISHGSPSHVRSVRGAFGRKRSEDDNWVVNFPRLRYSYYGPDLSAIYDGNTVSTVGPAGNIVREDTCDLALFFDPGSDVPTFARDYGLRSMGRGFSRFIERVTDVKELAGGKFDLCAEGRLNDSYPGRWELVIEPEAGWMVREARFLNRHGRFVKEMTNEGLIRAGPLAIPKTSEMDWPTTISLDSKIGVNFETVRAGFDEELFQRAREAVVGPHPPGTMISDRRGGQFREAWVTGSGAVQEAVMGPQPCSAAPDAPGRPWYVLPRDLAFIGLLGAAFVGAVLVLRMRSPSRS